MDVLAFRQHYPEFSDTTTYTDELIGYHAEFAEASVSTSYPPAKRGYLVELLTAHLVAEATSYSGSGSQSGSGAGSVGMSTGRVASKSVMEASISYDYSGVKDTPHNSTRYGQKYDAETASFRTGGFVVGGYGGRQCR